MELKPRLLRTASTASSTRRTAASPVAGGGPGAGAECWRSRGLLPLREAARSGAPVRARRHTERTAKDAAEMGGIGEAPAGRDGTDCAVGLERVAQVAAAAFEPAGADPSGHRGAGVVENAVQVPGGDEMRCGDGRRRQLR